MKIGRKYFIVLWCVQRLLSPSFSASARNHLLRLHNEILFRFRRRQTFQRLNWTTLPSKMDGHEDGFR